MDIKEVETNLRNRLDDQTRRLEGIEQRLRGTHSSSFSEQAIEREEDEVDEQLEETVINEIGLIKAALERIGTGTYQTCSSCGGTISEQRLQALPYTSLCIDCAEQQNG